MAKQTNLRFSGSTAIATYYERLGEFYVRSRPKKVRQTKATKKSAGNFGLANCLSGKLREGLKPAIPHPADRQMMYRFTDALYQWLLQNEGNPITGDIAPLQQFHFNAATGIAERWKIPIDVSQAPGGNITVNFPAFVPTDVISAPAHTLAVECTITVVAVSLNNAILTDSSTLKITMPYTSGAVPENTVTVPVNGSSGIMLVTAVRLQYLLPSAKYCKRPAFMPASVIDARLF